MKELQQIEMSGAQQEIKAQMGCGNAIPKALNAAYGHKPHGHNIT
jgi:hypothetical protein